MLRIVNRVRSLLDREQFQQDITDEVQSHIEFETRKYIRSGLSKDEAERQANIALGGRVRAIEQCREERGIPFIEKVIQDCRHAFRAFGRSPVFALTVVLTIAIGVGANSTVFAFCKAILLSTLPVPNPQQLHLVSVEIPGTSSDTHFSFPDLQNMAKTVGRFAALTGFTETVDYHLEDESGTSSAVKGQLVAGNFFSALGVIPSAGRILSERDNVPGQEAVAVLRYQYSLRRFGSNSSVIGERLFIQRQPVTVVGVMPRDFDGVEPGVRPDVWMPLSVQPLIGYGGYASMNDVDPKKPWVSQDVSWLHVLARSKDSKRLYSLLTHWLNMEIADQLPQVTDTRQRSMMGKARIIVTAAAGGLPSLRNQFSYALMILLALVSVLLFSCCVNVVNLLLARSRAQMHEAAIRVALGISRMRLITNRMSEALLLVLAGGALSFPLAAWGATWILHWLVVGRDLQIDLGPNWSVFAFTAGLTLAAGITVGLLPALRTADFSSSRSLAQRNENSAATTPRAARISLVLVAGQVAFSLASLVIAGLLTRTLVNYGRLDIGMDRQHVLSVGIDPSSAGYNNAATLNALYQQLPTALDRIPGVVSSSVAGCGLMGDGCATVPATVSGEVNQTSGFIVERNYVGPRYFSTVGMNLVQGRGITERDAIGTVPIGVINEEFERQFLHGENALGRVVHADGHAVQIVGVVEDARSDNIHQRAQPYLFVPVLQAEGGCNVSHIEIRTQGNPEAVADSVRSVLLHFNRAIPISEMITLADEVNSGLARELLLGRLAGLFSALTLLIEGIGLYGIFAYETTLRRPEFAVRVALGATAGSLLSLVVKRASLICLAGSAVGLLLSMCAARFVSSLLFGTGVLDGWSYAGSLLAILAVSSIAVFVPAQRAASVDPASNLRSE